MRGSAWRVVLKREDRRQLRLLAQSLGASSHALLRPRRETPAPGSYAPSLSLRRGAENAA